MTATIAYIPMSIEETGTLYHMMMAQFRDMALDPSKPIENQLPLKPDDGITSRATDIAILERMRALLWKLGGANDRLMGKV